MTVAASPCLPPALSSQGNPADWGQRWAPSSRTPGRMLPTLPMGCQPRALLLRDSLSPMRIPAFPTPPAVTPCVSPMSPRSPCPLAGCSGYKADARHRPGSWSQLLEPGLCDGDGRPGAVGILLPASIWQPLFARPGARKPNPANPTLPGAGAAARSPTEVFKGQARSDAVLSLWHGADTDCCSLCCCKQQPRLETTSGFGVRPPLHPTARLPTHVSPWTAPHRGGDTPRIPVGCLPEPPCLPGHRAAAPHPLAWGFSPFLSLFHQFVSLALLVTKVRH